MVQCHNLAIIKYNNEINLLLNKLKNELNDSQYSLLLKSQDYWNNFFNTDKKLLEITLESKMYFEPHLVSAGIKSELFKQRYQELNELYQLMKE